MSVSRRRFLRSAAVVSAALVLKPSTFALGKDSTWSNNAADNQVGLQSYSREMFEPYIGDTFRVRVGKQMVDLKLESLTSIKPVSGITTGKIARTDCFSMRFNAVKPIPGTATVHTLDHGKLGSFNLLMVQSKKGGKFLQTAIINQVV